MNPRSLFLQPTAIGVYLTIGACVVACTQPTGGTDLQTGDVTATKEKSSEPRETSQSEEGEADLPGLPAAPNGTAVPVDPSAASDAGSGAANGGDPCLGMPDGFAPKQFAKGAPQRCCGGALVAMDSPTSCGACGIACAAGRACEQVAASQYSCTCAGNAECTGTGAGAGATCYEGFCNCQCPNGETSCTNVCAGGATCNDIPGQNFCAYP